MSAMLSFYSCGSKYSTKVGIIQFSNWTLGGPGDTLDALGDKGGKGEQPSLNPIPSPDLARTVYFLKIYFICWVSEPSYHLKGLNLKFW